jgi:hypothetical protein
VHDDHHVLRVGASRRWLLITIALLLVAGASAATCRNGAPHGGFGVFVFAGDGNSRALDSPDALGINPLFNWADLEPAEGAYNWAPIDEALAAAHEKGKRVVPRVYTNVGDFDQATPQWVFDAGAERYRFGDTSDTDQPVPTDPVFSEKFGDFLAVLGQRYNGNPDIEFFQTNAAMGGYGEMVWSYGDADPPPGWSPQTEIDTVAHWIDRWRAAFPDTDLAVTINPITSGVAEAIADYAVDRHFFLQTNTPDQAPAAIAIFKQYAPFTRIVLEIENNGCQDATGADFDALAEKVFGYGFPVDYLSVCGASFDDAARLHAARDRLRKGGG